VGSAGGIEAGRHLDALQAGVANLERHVQNLSVYGVPVIVAINRFPQDTDAELSWLTDWCARTGVRVAVADVWARGGAGAVDLARQVTEAIAEDSASYRSLWTEAMDVEERIDAVVQRIYRGSHVEYSAEAKRQLAQLTEEGWGHLPVCMAKNQYSFTDDPTVLGAPIGFGIMVRELVVRPGAGFIVALTGTMMTMPGLPRSPAADVMDVDADGRISGLF
jgi:formate--tetrahydrofolate ligase